MQRLTLPHFLVFVSILLVVLHPYTIYGKPGLVIALAFAVYAIKQGLDKSFVRDFLVPALVLLALAMFGALSSVVNGISQRNHPMAVIAFLVMLLGARGIFVYSRRLNLSLDGLLLMILAAVVMNCVIILLEIQFDPFRQLIEGYLDQLSEGSINYAVGFRLRGISTSGGAGLSISVPAAFIIAFYLFDRGRIGGLALLALSCVLFSSVMVIGRTGVVLIAVPLVAYLAMLMSKRNGVFLVARTGFIVLFFILLIAPIFYQLITTFFSDMFGDAFVKYAFGFLLDGEEGIREEGTVGAIAGFLLVLPLQFPQALTGYGFYGGSEFNPWTDSGYSRTFLSVGFVAGVFFYFVLFRMFFLAFRKNKYLIGSFVLLLAIAEAKEPLLYSGPTSRMFILILVYCYCARTSGKPAAEVPAGHMNGVQAGGPASV